MNTTNAVNTIAPIYLHLNQQQLAAKCYRPNHINHPINHLARPVERQNKENNANRMLVTQIYLKLKFNHKSIDSEFCFCLIKNNVTNGELIYFAITKWTILHASQYIKIILFLQFLVVLQTSWVWLASWSGLLKIKAKIVQILWIPRNYTYRFNVSSPLCIIPTFSPGT